MTKLLLVPLHLDKTDEHYSYLAYASAVGWTYLVKNHSKSGRTTRKKAVIAFLLKHAKVLDLLLENGEPDTKNIEIISKVCNWDTKK